jgi:hypothetical protein
LDRLNQVVEISTHELAVDYGPQTVENVGLGRGAIQILLDDVNEGLDLGLSQVLIGSIGPYQFGCAPEQRVQEIVVRRRTCRFEELKDLV